MLGIVQRRPTDGHAGREHHLGVAACGTTSKHAASMVYMLEMARRCETTQKKEGQLSLAANPGARDEQKEHKAVFTQQEAVVLRHFYCFLVVLLACYATSHAEPLVVVEPPPMQHYKGNS